MDFDDIGDELLNQFMDSFEEQENLIKENTSLTEPPSNKAPAPEHLQVLSRFFGHQSFRPMQWEIISAIISEKRDVCAVMSTGYGKSLCFQFPSMFLGGVTLVVSPLISLMEDQVLSLQVSNIPACLLGTAQRHQKQVIDDIFQNKYTFVYLTPEFCTGDYGIVMLQKMMKELKVVLIAIDEAHCISSWGHDFRYQYRSLGVLRTIFTNVPIIAVTATATSKVRQDIVENLHLCNPLQVCTGFDRPNLYFEVNSKGPGGIYKDLMKVMINEDSGYKLSGSTIIYCITRRETEEVALVLKSNGIKCRPYHAGLPLSDREEAHELFVKDKIDVIVGTIAFGMGIDKPDIRNVIHYGCAQSIENYYQEVGRAGRDGLPSSCITFYANGDLSVIRGIISLSINKDEKGLQKMEEYLTSCNCRRRFILEYFEDKFDHLDKPRKSCCDNCTKKLQDPRSDHQKYEGIDENGCYDFTTDANIFLKAVHVHNTPKLGLSTYVLFVRGSNSARVHENKRRLPEFGSGKKKSEAWWQAVARFLIQQKYLEENTIRSTGFSYAAISMTEKGRSFMFSTKKLVLPPSSTILKLLTPKKISSDTWISTSRPIISVPSTSKTVISTKTKNESEFKSRMEIYRKLLDQRADIASRLDCMPYMIASNAVLMAMSKLKPTTLIEMKRLNLDGFPEAKINKFGNKFLSVITGKSVESQMPTDRKLSIAEALTFYPLLNVSSNVSGKVSYSMFQSGLTLSEIAEKRGVTKGTIVAHLVSEMKIGEPIKMIELGVSEELRDVIIDVINRNFSHIDLEALKLPPIKELCPPEVNYDEIKIVLAYLQVRNHLENLKISYVEFEDFSFRDVYTPVTSTVVQDLKSSSPTITSTIQDSKNSTTISLQNENKRESEAPAKKFKVDSETNIEDDLDAIFGVPFEDIKPQCEEETKLQNEEELTPPELASKSKKATLPPWLVVKKID